MDAKTDRSAAAYVSPAIEVIQFDTEDIICTSAIQGDPDVFHLDT